MPNPLIMDTCYVTGMGRSGTKLLTSLLKRVQGVDARHEHIGNREFWLLSWYLGNDSYTIPYLERVKKRLETDYNADLFIDVNGYLQNAVPALRQVFQPKQVFHFVRNPKSVVRSLYTRRNEADTHLLPKSKDEIEKWLDNDKFYQVCWNWSSTTLQLLEQNTRLILAENIIGDYDYFRQMVLDPLHLQLPSDSWQQCVSVKVNKTQSRTYRKLYAVIKGKTFVAEQLPEYEEWPEDKKRVFSEICGPVMRRCGYAL